MLALVFGMTGHSEESPPLMGSSDAKDLRSTSITPLSTQTFACPVHGMVGAFQTCKQCEKKPYDLSLPDDRAVLRNLRGVQKSARMTRARIIAYPISAIMFFLLPIGFLKYFVIAGAGEVFSRLVDVALAAAEPKKIRALEKELNP